MSSGLESQSVDQSLAKMPMRDDPRIDQARLVAAREPAGRHWVRHDFSDSERAPRLRLSSAVVDEIDAGLRFAAANGLTAETVEQEDFRLPSLAREVPALRQVLDHGPGFVTLQGVPVQGLQADQTAMLAWVLGNYFGRPTRQGISADRRFFTVTDRGVANNDPTRIGASSQRSPMHTDNGCLEPRPPCYIGLLCVQQAGEGGESRLVSARTLFNTIEDERPDLLQLYFDTYAFRAPQMHVWPNGLPYVCKPIFEVRANELQVHYARVMIEPGMQMAGMPLTSEQRTALDYFDALLERDELVYETRLDEGDMLLVNNLVLLHGREAFTPSNGRYRVLQRIWMRRRDVGPGDDPVALDLEEVTP